MSTETETPTGNELTAVDTMRDYAERYAALLVAKPRDLDAAITRLYACETDYEALAAKAGVALDAWAEADLIKARVKNQSVEKLIAGGMSRSAAEKAASDHDDYTAHRDKLAALDKTKRETEESREIAKTRLYNARTVVEAYAAYSRPITYAAPTGTAAAVIEAIRQGATPVETVALNHELPFPRAELLDDPYENPTPLYVGEPKEPKHKRGPKAKSELPPVPPTHSLAISESLLIAGVVRETVKDYEITIKPVEKDDEIPSLVYAVRGLIPSRVMAGRWPDGGVIIVSRQAIESPGAHVEVTASVGSNGYTETIIIPITARLCEICGERGCTAVVYDTALCDDCETNARSAEIDYDRSHV